MLAATENIDDLVLGKGYEILKNCIPISYIDNFLNLLDQLYPVRAISSHKIYAESEGIKNLEDISVWWSQTVLDLPVVRNILEIVNPIISNISHTLVPYTSDVVFINAHSTFVSAHVDTPYRFKQWNFDKRLLGIQCIISLQDTDKINGVTGLVPFSQKRDFDINKCYNGEYNKWFVENCKQHDMPKGSLLFYNSRVLHSSMPNTTDKTRPALLINYIDRNIFDEVSKIDNVWTSNGKRP